MAEVRLQWGVAALASAKHEAALRRAGANSGSKPS